MEIYVDGSQNENDELFVGLMGMNGDEKLFCYASYLPISGDNMTAEQIAILTALELIADKYSEEKVTIYSDQAFYVEFLNSGKMRTKYFSTHEYIALLYETFRKRRKNVRIRYIKRGKNKADKILRKFKENRLDKELLDPSINLSFVKVLQKAESYKFKANIASEISPKRFYLKSGKLTLVRESG